MPSKPRPRTKKSATKKSATKKASDVVFIKLVVKGGPAARRPDDAFDIVDRMLDEGTIQATFNGRAQDHGLGVRIGQVSSMGDPALTPVKSPKGSEFKTPDDLTPADLRRVAWVLYNNLRDEGVSGGDLYDTMGNVLDNLGCDLRHPDDMPASQQRRPPVSRR